MMIDKMMFMTGDGDEDEDDDDDEHIVRLIFFLDV